MTNWELAFMCLQYEITTFHLMSEIKSKKGLSDELASNREFTCHDPGTDI